MLHTVTQLAQDDLGHIGRALCHEVNAHALGANQADYLLNLVGHGLRRILEEHVRLVEEEDELRQGKVAHLGQLRVEVREEPQQEGTVQFGLHHQLIGSQHVHDALSVAGLQQVVYVETGFTKELIGPLALEGKERALYSPDGCS